MSWIEEKHEGLLFAAGPIRLNFCLDVLEKFLETRLIEVFKNQHVYSVCTELLKACFCVLGIVFDVSKIMEAFIAWLLA